MMKLVIVLLAIACSATLTYHANVNGDSDVCLFVEFNEAECPGLKDVLVNLGYVAGACPSEHARSNCDSSAEEQVRTAWILGQALFGVECGFDFNDMSHGYACPPSGETRQTENYYGTRLIDGACLVVEVEVASELQKAFDAGTIGMSSRCPITHTSTCDSLTAVQEKTFDVMKNLFGNFGGENDYTLSFLCAESSDFTSFVPLGDYLGTFIPVVRPLSFQLTASITSWNSYLAFSQDDAPDFQSRDFAAALIFREGNIRWNDIIDGKWGLETSIVDSPIQLGSTIHIEGTLHSDHVSLTIETSDSKLETHFWFKPRNILDVNFILVTDSWSIHSTSVSIPDESCDESNDSCSSGYYCNGGSCDSCDHVLDCHNFGIDSTQGVANCVAQCGKEPCGSDSACALTCEGGEDTCAGLQSHADNCASDCSQCVMDLFNDLLGCEGEDRAIVVEKSPEPRMKTFHRMDSSDLCLYVDFDRLECTGLTSHLESDPQFLPGPCPDTHTKNFCDSAAQSELDAVSVLGKVIYSVHCNLDFDDVTYGYGCKEGWSAPKCPEECAKAIAAADSNAAFCSTIMNEPAKGKTHDFPEACSALGELTVGVCMPELYNKCIDDSETLICPIHEYGLPPVLKDCQPNTCLEWKEAVDTGCAKDVSSCIKDEMQGNLQCTDKGTDLPGSSDSHCDEETSCSKQGEFCHFDDDFGKKELKAKGQCKLCSHTLCALITNARARDECLKKCGEDECKVATECFESCSTPRTCKQLKDKIEHPTACGKSCNQCFVDVYNSKLACKGGNKVQSRLDGSSASTLSLLLATVAISLFI